MHVHENSFFLFDVSIARLKFQIRPHLWFKIVLLSRKREPSAPPLKFCKFANSVDPNETIKEEYLVWN